jgi:hypothetical protein
MFSHFEKSLAAGSREGCENIGGYYSGGNI